MRYAVAVLNNFDSVNQVTIVEANSELEAIVLSVGEDREYATTLIERYDSVEDLVEYYRNGELSVSVPVKIE